VPSLNAKPRFGEVEKTLQVHVQILPKDQKSAGDFNGKSMKKIQSFAQPQRRINSTWRKFFFNHRYMWIVVFSCQFMMPNRKINAQCDDCDDSFRTRCKLILLKLKQIQ
jgi:hypothetical protein